MATQDEQAQAGTSARAGVMPPMVREMLELLPQTTGVFGKLKALDVWQIEEKLGSNYFDVVLTVGKAEQLGYAEAVRFFDLDGDLARVKVRITERGMDAIEKALQQDEAA